VDAIIAQAGVGGVEEDEEERCGAKGRGHSAEEGEGRLNKLLQIVTLRRRCNVQGTDPSC
jgi:hypothetical protein